MHNRYIFSIFFNMKVCCVFSLELPHECTQYTIFNLKKKNITLNYPKSVAMPFFQGTKERVRNTRGKRTISVRATEGLPYVETLGHRADIGELPSLEYQRTLASLPFTPQCGTIVTKVRAIVFYYTAENSCLHDKFGLVLQEFAELGPVVQSIVSLTSSL